MSVHLQKDIKNVEKQLLDCSALVEQTLIRSINALINADREEADRVIAGDDSIDEREISIEEDCLKILALHQPVAIDLRFLVSVLKINNDLERIGDYCVSIAKRTKTILDFEDDFSYQLPFGNMTDKTITLIKDSINSLVMEDVKKAYTAIGSIDAINSMKNEMFSLFITEVQNNPEKAEILSHQMIIARYLDRIAEHAVNIAEDMIYMIDGEIVRHKLG
ncbi:phosphate signaling complex protein PhoU [Chitinivibrio alkaliphilus]|uniref:Phosphate-specific transport system accessory protein PhoU n=1 Tax=Chitinivibrio alkaliphilus ACht1 TaxID=1313304 RepID=U7D606_9BACT|nr:phosphate signaling complex protein PhoU [Chitinivibrio alkaliphilus]ERP31011.1 phosphate transport system regulatory protein PhoU [Chitinivibrio alkaliphilus ACht1]